MSSYATEWHSSGASWENMTNLGIKKDNKYDNMLIKENLKAIKGEILGMLLGGAQTSF